MGLFDTIVCKYPLPAFKEFQDEHFQTKDLESQMSRYEITEEGALMVPAWEDPNSRQGHGAYMYPYTGTLRFYTIMDNKAAPYKHDEQWLEFKTEFWAGKLVSIKCISPKGHNDEEV